MSQSIKFIAIIIVSIVVAFAGSHPAQAFPLRTLQGTVVDAQGKAVAGSIVYLHDEQTHAIRTTVADRHGRYRFSGIRFYTDYRIHAEHKALMSAIREIPAHSTDKLIKMDLKIDRKKPAAASFAETESVSILATEPNDRSFKHAPLHLPVAGANTL